MKNSPHIIIALIICFVSSIPSAMSQSIVAGKIADDKGEPLPGANIYIVGTLDGGVSDEYGNFSFATEQSGTVSLTVSSLGYIPYTLQDEVGKMSALHIRMRPQTQALNEVVVTAGNYRLKSASTLERKGNIDLVTTGGSGGDLYSALGLMPGVQAEGIDGRLLVRGGSNRETQTFIDGMHVMKPYTESAQTSGSRGRYSPFLFGGINFSTGGYGSEFSQSLSGILPLETKDESALTKMGVSLMNVGPGIGGTKAWQGGSASFDLNYTDMGLYHSLLAPSQNNYWPVPYRNLSAQGQLRLKLGKKTYWKTFAAYDKTRLVHYEYVPFNPMRREMSLSDDNIYINSTVSGTSDRIKYFAGAAFSRNVREVGQSRTFSDRFHDSEQEWHLKAKASLRFSPVYKLEAGAEGYLRKYDMSYEDSLSFAGVVRPTIIGVFVSNDFNISSRVFLNLSSRLEYTSPDGKAGLLPRAAVNYQWKGLTASAVVGKYQQLPENDYLLHNRRLLPETNLQYLLGLYFRDKTRIYRVEAYHKQYGRLPLVDNSSYSSGGAGYSRGIDLFINGQRFLRHWEYMFAYSYNDSRRHYLDYPTSAQPAFARKHNVSITLKYSNFALRSIVGLTGRWASCLPYNEPDKVGFVRETTPSYRTIDVCWTLLAHKKLIIYASFNNILNRKNVYGYYADGKPLLQSLPQTLYVGFFLTLGKNVAYEAGNF